MATIIIICAILLIAFAVYSTVRKMRGKAKSSCCGGPEVKTVKKVADMDQSHYPFRYEVGIEGMHCSNCARAVENALHEKDGVWATVELGRKLRLRRDSRRRGRMQIYCGQGIRKRTLRPNREDD